MNNKLEVVVDTLCNTRVAQGRSLKECMKHLLSGDDDGKKMAFTDPQDAQALSLTLLGIALAVLSFFGGRGDAFGSTLLVMLRHIESPGSVFMFNVYAASIAASGVVMALIGLALASRWPRVGYGFSLLFLTASYALFGYFTEDAPWIAIGFISLLVGGLISIAFFAPREFLTPSVAIIWLTLFFTLGFIVLSQSANLYNNYMELTWIAKIKIPLVSMGAIALFAIAFGRMAVLLCASSSHKVSPFATAAYTLCVLLFVIWWFLLMSILRRKGQKSAENGVSS